MSCPVVITGAAGGSQGFSGRRIASLLMERGVAVRAPVHKLDASSDYLREAGAGVAEGDLLDQSNMLRARDSCAPFRRGRTRGGRLRREPKAVQPLRPLKDLFPDPGLTSFKSGHWPQMTARRKSRGSC